MLAGVVCFREWGPATAGASVSTPQPDLTLAEVAELRRFTPRYLRELIRRHQIPVLRSGRLIRFDALSLFALEEALRCRSRRPAQIDWRPHYRRHCRQNAHTPPRSKRRPEARCGGGRRTRSRYPANGMARGTSWILHIRRDGPELYRGGAALEAYQGICAPVGARRRGTPRTGRSGCRNPSASHTAQTRFQDFDIS